MLKDMNIIKRICNWFFSHNALHDTYRSSKNSKNIFIYGCLQGESRSQRACVQRIPTASISRDSSPATR